MHWCLELQHREMSTYPGIKTSVLHLNTYYQQWQCYIISMHIQVDKYVNIMFGFSLRLTLKAVNYWCKRKATSGSVTKNYHYEMCAQYFHVSLLCTLHNLLFCSCERNGVTINLNMHFSIVPVSGNCNCTSPWCKFFLSVTHQGGIVLFLVLLTVTDGL